MRNMVLCAALLILSGGLAVGQAQEKVLWSFGGYPTDGSNPVASLISDKAGNFYGTTQLGGSQTGCHINGCGTVFELSPQADGTWAEAVLYNFCSDYSNQICVDGEQPEAGLVVDAAGNLYGTTPLGGTTQFEGGTVFELSPPQLPGGAWTFATIYGFCSVVSGQVCEDGENPHGQLALDATGNLYGTTTAGGNGHSSKAYGEGTVFELSHGANGWTETVLYNFCTLGQ